MLCKSHDVFYLQENTLNGKEFKYFIIYSAFLKDSENLAKSLCKGQSWKPELDAVIV